MNADVFVHSHALCESSDIGAKTRIWAFAHVLKGAKIGSDCNICDHVFIENDVVVGDRVTVKCGVQLWDGVRLGNDVFVGPNVTFTNDLFPRSKAYPEKFLETVVGDGASLGANSTILPGVRIGEKAMVGAGAVVTQSIPPFAKVVGNPARIIGYVNTESLVQQAGEPKLVSPRLMKLSSHKDIRGQLNVGEFEKLLPFKPKRFFIVSGVPSAKVRGEHAHKVCHQFLICVSGSVRAIVDDGTTREMFVLDDPSLGLHMPPMTWGTQYDYSDDAVLLVFASELYDAGDYVRDYEEFKALVR